MYNIFIMQIFMLHIYIYIYIYIYISETVSTIQSAQLVELYVIDKL